MANIVSMKQLLEAGVHFGHPTRKWNPKMKKYIYTARNDIYIINLEKTVVLIEEAYNFIREVASNGKSILFVGTKKQAQEAIMAEANKCGMFFVRSRWLGGTLTNFTTIRSRIERMNKLNLMEKMNEFNLLPKKEVAKLKAERDGLEENLGGIKDMRNLPGALFVVDPKKEHLAVAEARKLKIPIVGIVDTNCDPDEVDYVIPGNDDAIRAIKLIAGAMADAVIEAREGEEGLAKRREIEAQILAESAAAAAALNMADVIGASDFVPESGDEGEDDAEADGAVAEAEEVFAAAEAEEAEEEAEAGSVAEALETDDEE